jgi:hypothetical protein
VLDGRSVAASRAAAEGGATSTASIRAGFAQGRIRVGKVAYWLVGGCVIVCVNIYIDGNSAYQL